MDILVAGLTEGRGEDAPLAIDLCCGLGGWTEGLLAEGYRVRGYDIEAHEYGDEKYPAELVLRNVLEMHGSELADADLIVASPPCTEFSYMAMPWSRAKQIARALRGEDEFPPGYKGSRTRAELTAIFDACFRLQREASEAAGRHIPMVVENVKGAQPWVGRAKWAFGSYFLWGDVPALMPPQRYHQRLKVKAGEQWNVNRPNFTGTRGWDDEGLKNPGFRFDGSGKSFQSESVNRHVAQYAASTPSEGFKTEGLNWSDRSKRGQDFTRVGGLQAEGHKHRDADGYDRSHPEAFGWKGPRTSSGAKAARKAASAKIAKIPFALSSHIARVYRPRADAAA
jgi:hypothetical protein